MSAINPAPSADTPITIKIALANGENRRFKLALRECGANTLSDKLRFLLAVQPDQDIILERFSDSAGSYITLDGNNPSVYKQLYRAAKAKLKLRMRATIVEAAPATGNATAQSEPATPDCLTSHRYVPPVNHDAIKDQASQIKMAEAAIDSHVTNGSGPASLKAFTAALASLDGKHKEEPTHDSLQLQAQQCKVKQMTSKSPVPAEVKVEAPALLKKEIDDEAPVPREFSAREHFYAELASMSKGAAQMRVKNQALSTTGTSFTICCNHCDSPIPDGHWHCSICEDGDFDLCSKCVANNVLCPVEGHWLIKRFVKDGRVMVSTTETIAPKQTVKTELEKEIPGAFTNGSKEEEFSDPNETSRTCNSCVGVFDESRFVTCTVCEDYDLCLLCHVGMKHGHHPGHGFKPASEEATLDILATRLCLAGRNVSHYAVCDGCDDSIFGVRHKCMNCPDWDYCSTCIQRARHTHPGHRFVPIYEPIPHPAGRSQRHYGIHCDGPLCKDKASFIVGDRYKCAVCHDTDFCANCEALPTHRHNRTHPLIKFRSPVRNVSVTTLGEKDNGEVMYTMGDKITQTSSKSTETTPTVHSSNAATQVQTVAEVKPVEPAQEEAKDEVKEESKEEVAKVVTVPEYQAHFVRDAVADGSKLRPSFKFEQVWTLRNPGPYAWPAGCSVRFIGGDNMLNVDSEHPSSVSDIAKAIGSNVIDRVVEVGEEVDFTVVMKTPKRQGKAISYWRLKAADGWQFGNKLWCDIDVSVPEQAAVSGVTTEHIEDVAKEVKVEEPKDEEHHSQMIFPKLDKESPVSSTHGAEALGTAEMGEPELDEEMENLGLDGEEDTDDGFLTDEEYEVLDGSDEELIEAVNGKK